MVRLNEELYHRAHRGALPITEKTRRISAQKGSVCSVRSVVKNFSGSGTRRRLDRPGWKR